MRVSRRSEHFSSACFMCFYHDIGTQDFHDTTYLLPNPSVGSSWTDHARALRWNMILRKQASMKGFSPRIRRKPMCRQIWKFYPKGGSVQPYADCESAGSGLTRNNACNKPSNILVIDLNDNAKHANTARFPFLSFSPM